VVALSPCRRCRRVQHAPAGPPSAADEALGEHVVPMAAAAAPVPPKSTLPSPSGGGGVADGGDCA
jgi:hypothetical protein